MTFTRISMIAIACLAASAAVAQEKVEPSHELPSLEVLGGKEAVRLQAGSAVYLSREDIDMQNDVNINRILQRVPGVYIREEDGYGNFPNISLRGADGTRSEKVTLMEDGILSAPAPYSAPGAYYSPNAARMNGIEIIKGSSQVRFGPHTTGGALNYLSTPIPEEATARLRATYGEDNTQTAHLYGGETVDTDSGRVGYLVELFGMHTDGFRDIQKSGQGAGFRRIEPMVKLFWEPDTATPQRFEVKVGWTDFEADESYLGLSEADVETTPYDRYTASQFDNIDTEHLRSYLRYSALPTDNLEVESTLYYNKFKRNWYKIDHVSTDPAPGVDSRGRIADRTSLHTALLRADPLAVLKGNAEGSIGVKANRRKYESYGWQNRATLSFETGELDHRLSGGLRLHKDYIDRYQNVDLYSTPGGGDFRTYREGTPGEEADRRQETFATAIYVEDEIRSGALTVKPGVRWEFLDQSVDDRGDKLDGDFNTWAAGVGMTYELSPNDTLFGGVYRGISVPGPNARLSDDINEEESVNYELGYRRTADAYSLELAGFYTDYSNLIGTDTGLALSGGSNVNAGEATVRGVEFMTASDLSDADDAFSLPVYFSLTYTDAELDNALASGGAEDIYSGGEAGADLPYVPEWKLAFGAGVEQGPFSIRLDGTWVDESFGTARNLDAPDTSARQGKIDDALVFDLTGGWMLNDSLELFAGVRNLFDETYLTSRIPEGPRNAAPRTAYVGFEWNWGAE